MFIEPYQTSLLKGYPVKKLVDQLEVHYIDGSLAPVAFGARAGGMTGELGSEIVEINPGVSGIDPLLAPLMIGTRQGPKVVIDSRATKRERRDGAPVVAQPSDYRFAVREAGLTFLWATEGAAGFSQLGILPIRVFARWFSEGIVRKQGLDPMDQLRLQILAAYYYVSAFTAEEMTEGRRVGYASLISRALSVPTEQILRVTEHAGVLTGLSSLVEACRSGEGASVRLESLSPALVYTLLGGSWYGARSRNIVATALEYPPTFITMLLTAYSDRTYHSSYFAKTAVMADKHSLSREFILALNHLSRGLTDE